MSTRITSARQSDGATWHARVAPAQAPVCLRRHERALGDKCLVSDDGLYHDERDSAPAGCRAR